MTQKGLLAVPILTQLVILATRQLPTSPGRLLNEFPHQHSRPSCINLVLNIKGIGKLSTIIAMSEQMSRNSIRIASFRFFKPIVST